MYSGKDKTLNLLKCKRPPIGTVWKLEEEGVSPRHLTMVQNDEVPHQKPSKKPLTTTAEWNKTKGKERDFPPIQQHPGETKGLHNRGKFRGCTAVTRIGIRYCLKRSEGSVSNKGERCRWRLHGQHGLIHLSASNETARDKQLGQPDLLCRGKLTHRVFCAPPRRLFSSWKDARGITHPEKHGGKNVHFFPKREESI
ncbi:hypothetical protein TNCV_2206261 [Trichonephila clavipes]|uniref:Uncharacterized protein n=1 Tax=Trichonephila clavipes TaxID=2585209 RepID=A0A8X6VGH7_TRICX|nr:hypothetical protein TNCV_2206261 [Trichonephila clavipes]